MPYVIRNKSGEIVAIHQNQVAETGQWEQDITEEHKAFIQKQAMPTEAKQALTGSDNEMARVIEDLVDLLMEKQIFVYTELPEAVQAKLNIRKQLRQDLNTLDNLVNEDDGIF